MNHIDLQILLGFSIAFGRPWSFPQRFFHLVLRHKIIQVYKDSSMDIKSWNKALASQCTRALRDSFVCDFEQGYQQIYYCSDTDTVKYKVVSANHSVKLYFYFVDLNNVWKYIEQHFRKNYYQNFAVKVVNQGNQPALQIALDNEGFTSLNKSTNVKEDTGVLTGKKKFDPLISVLSKRLASVKRHFLASPFQIMLQAAKQNAADRGNRSVPNFSFYIRSQKKEKVWLAFERNQITVYFGLNFDDKFEQQLGKIFFSELTDARKHVHNSPAVGVNDKEFPKLLIESFPEEKSQKYSFSNGIISFTLFGNLTKNHRAMASYLAGFRNYSYYHIQACKVYLHSRVLRRLQIFAKDLSLAKIEPFALK